MARCDKPHLAIFTDLAKKFLSKKLNIDSQLKLKCVYCEGTPSEDTWTIKVKSKAFIAGQWLHAELTQIVRPRGL